MRRAGGLLGLALSLPFALAAGPARHATLPAASPDGRSVAYVRELGGDSCELRTVGVDGRGDRLLWRAPFAGGLPGWLPDGSRATLLHTMADTTTLWSIAPSGGEPSVKLRLAGKSLVFSHDGKRVAYAAGDWMHSTLTVARADGGGARPLTGREAAWFNLAWSPDDRTLAATRSGPDHDMQVWLVDVASGSARALTKFTPEQGHPQWPTWSPDGRRIAVQVGRYSREHDKENSADVWVIEVRSGAARKLMTREGTWMDETPSWCADGRTLLFQSSRSGRFEVWRVGVDGSGARSLTP